MIGRNREPYHVVEAGGCKFRHHSLRERIVRRLEETKNDVIRPVTLLTTISGGNMMHVSYQNSQTL